MGMARIICGSFVMKESLLWDGHRTRGSSRADRLAGAHARAADNRVGHETRAAAACVAKGGRVGEEDDLAIADALLGAVGGVGDAVGGLGPEQAGHAEAQLVAGRGEEPAGLGGLFFLVTVFL